MPPAVPALAALALAMVLAACTPTVIQRGHAVDDEEVARIEVGQSTEQDVMRLLGSPTSASSFGERTWYYVSKRTENIAFMRPETTDQKVVAISFGDDGKVTEVRRLGLEEASAVDPASRKTPTAGQNITFLQQLFGNLGRFNSPAGGGGFASSRRR